MTIDAALNDTETAAMIWDALPIEASANTWGDEIYFGIPVSRQARKMGQEIVGLGELGYWPPGSAFCLFFGPTPMSRGDEIRPASPVTVSRANAWRLDGSQTSSIRRPRIHRANLNPFGWNAHLHGFGRRGRKPLTYKEARHPFVNSHSREGPATYVQTRGEH